MGDGNWDVGMSIIRETVRGWVSGPHVTGEDLSNLQAGLSYADHCLHAAERVADFRQSSGAVERLQRARQGIGAIQRVLGAIDVFRDVESVRSAIEELRRIGNISNNPTGAARAFGQLFSALGRLSSRLPPPANSYSSFLAESGDFFGNVLSDLDPNQRYQHREDLREAQRRF